MKSIVVVGAGLAGLTCARRLREAGVEAVVLEAADAVGGRMRTDRVDGFQLDRGFQVLLTAYPEAQRWLDFDALELQPFWPGTSVWNGTTWHRVADPRRRWSDLLGSLLADIGSTADKLRVVQWALRALGRPPDDAWMLPETTSLAHLQALGFSAQMIERFWRPWLTGIFLEEQLETSNRMLEYVFGMFTRGATVVPRRGMQAIPEQLAAGLQADAVRLGVDVSLVEPGRICTRSGGEIPASQIVLAVDGAAAGRLGWATEAVTWRTARCLYFAADQALGGEPLLMLNGTRDGVVNHLAVMSAVCREYAPPGEALIMVGLRPSVPDDDAAVAAQARTQLTTWFGRSVEGWRLLRHSHVREALPVGPALHGGPVRPIGPGIWRCGDYLTHASIQGAMASGRATAEALLRTL